MDELKQELKELIVSELHLEDVTPAEIEDEAPLFGDGLGLDSIDALELVVALEKKFGVGVQPDDADKKHVFQSINALAKFISETQKAKAE